MTRRQETAPLADLDTDGFDFDVRDVNEGFFYGIPRAVIQRAEDRLLDPSTRSVAYFSMEFGLAPSVYRRGEPQANVCAVEGTAVASACGAGWPRPWNGSVQTGRPRGAGAPQGGVGP